MGIKTDELTSQIRRDITNGRLPAGVWLRQEDIARRYHVSRIPVRESLRQLRVEGLVEGEPGRGVYVATLSIDEIEELFEMRRLLEGMAMLRAVEVINEHTKREMHKQLEKMRQTDSVDAFLECDDAFHRTLIEASGQKHVLTAVINIRHKVERYLRFYMGIVGYLVPRVEEHELVMGAIDDQQPEEAQRLMDDHIRAVGTSVANAYRQVNIIYPVVPQR